MSDTTETSVLVVGASAAGLSTVEALRRKGHTGPITVLGAEVHAPYDRPPLSKQVLGGSWEPTRAALRSDELLAATGAQFVLGDPAVSLDVVSRSVRTESGRSFEADSVVIATGVAPRRLPAQEDLAGVHVLRSLEDTLALRAELLGARTLVVVGEGVLGSEIAATARTLGLDVTIAGPLAGPMAAQVGPTASAKLADLHAGHGVRLALGAAVTGLDGVDGRVVGVHLADARNLPADVVVVAIGGVPHTDWLRSSGLLLGDGVVCDAGCRAAEGIYAVGDVARWAHPVTGVTTRLENRTNATEQAAFVAAAILGSDAAYAPVPYFWSDQYDVKLQVFGTVPVDAQVEVVEGDLDSDRFVATYARDGHVVAVLGWNMPKQVRQHSRAIGSPVPVAAH